MKQPWIRSAAFDGAFILGPSLLSVAAVALFRRAHPALLETPALGWLVLVVGIDVAHVYGTLYRTYLDRGAMRARGPAFLLVPLLGWIGGVLLYTCGELTFWRGLAYLAVFHFIRQQYGFFRIYSRNEPDSGLDRAVIYLATLYPLIWWHTHMPRGIHWFIEGDFLALPWPWLASLTGAVYAAALLLYAVREARRERFNWPRNLLLGGTALSWYMGIVYFEGDLAFTVTNVVSHGIPYLALVWAHGRKRDESPWIYASAALPAFLGILVVAAYLEEGLWDGFVWRDHAAYFPGFQSLPRIGDAATLAWLVPLLALPQITHYILDGLIWRMRGRENRWKASFWEHSTWLSTTTAPPASSIASGRSAPS